MKLKVIAHPNAKEPRIKKDLFCTLHVYVKEPATEGKANEAVIKKLSELHNIPKSQIILISGHTSKSKVFEIN